MPEPSALFSRPTFQAGLDFGYGRNVATDSSDSSTQKNDSDLIARAYLLARNPLVGAEAGFMTLPTFRAHFATKDYPAYKGAPAGSYPQTADVTQEIKASAPYARLNLYGPSLYGAEPYAFYGKAKTRVENHEHAIYNGADESDYRETLNKMSNYYGLGVNVLLSKNVNLRAEYGRIPHAVDEYHTGDRNMSMGTIGLGFNF